MRASTFRRACRRLGPGVALALGLAVAPAGSAPGRPAEPPSGPLPAAAEEPGGTVARAVDAAVAELRARVKRLERPVHTYHYAPRRRIGLPEAGYLPPWHPEALAFVRAKVGLYWDLELPTAPMQAVSGLWVGIDPVICRHFGGVGDGWALIQVVLPAGFRFVDVRTHDDGRRLAERFADEARDALAAAGCDVAFPASLLTLRESRACRELAVAALGRLDADGILLNFPRMPFRACGDERPDGVFIVLRPSVLAGDRVRLMTRESVPADEAAEDRRRVRALFVRALAAGSERTPPWPELAGAGEPVDLDRWMRDALLGCGGHAEDSIPAPVTAAVGGAAPAPHASSID